MATDKQISFATTLVRERNISDSRATQLLERLPSLTTAEASSFIDYVKTLPRKAGHAAAPKQELADGMYLIGERIVKVQHAIHGSGNQYAKELIDGSFEYVAGLVGQVRREGVRMTIEFAKQYGALYGTCIVCGRTLTNEESIEAGIGPVCGAKV